MRVLRSDALARAAVGAHDAQIVRREDYLPPFAGMHAKGVCRLHFVLALCQGFWHARAPPPPSHKYCHASTHTALHPGLAGPRRTPSMHVCQRRCLHAFVWGRWMSTVSLQAWLCMHARSMSESQSDCVFLSTAGPGRAAEQGAPPPISSLFISINFAAMLHHARPPPSVCIYAPFMSLP